MASRASENHHKAELGNKVTLPEVVLREGVRPKPPENTEEPTGAPLEKGEQRRGRKPIFTEEIGRKFLSAISDMAAFKTAAGCCGVSPKTVYQWLKKGKAGDPVYEWFYKEYLENLSEPRRLIYRSAKELALGYVEDGVKSTLLVDKQGKPITIKGKKVYKLEKTKKTKRHPGLISMLIKRFDRIEAEDELNGNMNALTKGKTPAAVSTQLYKVAEMAIAAGDLDVAVRALDLNMELHDLKGTKGQVADPSHNGVLETPGMVDQDAWTDLAAKHQEGIIDVMKQFEAGNGEEPR